MARKYRVAQCYTGPVGSEIVRRMAGHPQLDLVGVLVHFPEKVGLDAGEMVGAAPNGVITTNRLDDIIALKPDAAIWSGSVNDIDAYVQLLEAGINVYTGIGCYYLPHSPDEPRLTAAALKGGASITAGGNIPGLIADALPLFLSGYTGKIRQLRMWQRNDMANGPSATQIQSLGVGFYPGEWPYTEAMNAGFTWTIGQSARMVADGLGLQWEDVRLESHELALAPEDYVLPASGLEIKKGMVAGVRWTWYARANGGRDFYRLVNEQSTRLDHGDDWRKTYDDPAWRVEIDGDPPIVCTFGWPSGTAPGKACHDLNAARAMAIVPRLIEARPGGVSVLDFPAPVAGDGLFG
ncbi:hypothetical protein ACFOD9_05485 [Novosphingobium bradum]|uniref:2,4-diaminopentanoate dehydrogenase C-terminal domain-containing protein n=1 Tax=Novosphingobium bradum TaxID=1737444 RepID=A0ABV7IPZ5_9SPHN